MSDVIDVISERMNIFHMYKALVFAAKTFEIIFISDYQACCYRCYQ